MSITEDDPADPTTPNVPWRVTHIEPLEGLRLRLRFVDGTEGEVEMARLVEAEDAGVLAALRDPEIFRQVYLVHGAVTWPGEIDLAPDAMYDAIRAEA